MDEVETNPFAPPETLAEHSLPWRSGRIAAWLTLLIPYLALPLLMLLPHAIRGGLLGFILFFPVVPMTIAMAPGLLCSELLKLIPSRYSFLLVGFYVVTIMLEYITLFDMIYPNFSWK